MNNTSTISFADAFSWLVRWLDESNLVVMAVIALFLRLLAVRLRTELPWKPAARYLSCFFLVVYLLHLSNTIDWFNDFPSVVGLLIRVSLSTYLFFMCVASPGVVITHLVVRYIQTELFALQKLTKDLAEQRAKDLKTKLFDTSLPSPPREETMRRNAHQAQLDFEFECQVLRDAGLDEDELEAALTQAKQKYLQRLKNALL